MYGLFQTLFFFGYMALGSAALGILCGEYCTLWIDFPHTRTDTLKSFVFCVLIMCVFMVEFSNKARGNINLERLMVG